MAEVHSDLNSLSKWYLLFLCGASFLLPWSQRFFLIFLRERDQEQAAKRRQRVAKETRRKRKTFANLCLESHFHADDSCQTYSGRKNVLRKLLRIRYRRLKAGFPVC